MLRINIICVGKFKEKYWEAASAEYMKRLGAYCNVSVTEVREEKLPAHASRADEETVIEREGKSILDKLNAGDFVIALDIGGRELSSEALAAKIADMPTGWLCGQTARDFRPTQKSQMKEMDIENSPEFRTTKFFCKRNFEDFLFPC